MSNIEARVLYEYNGQDSTELSVKVEEKIFITSLDIGNGWSEARNENGNIGVLPTTYFELLSSAKSTTILESKMPSPTENIIDEDDSFDSDDDVPSVPTRPKPIALDKSISRITQFISESGKVPTIKMTKNFLKNGGEDFILGQGKPSIRTEAIVEVVNKNSYELCVWKALVPDQNCMIVSHGVDAKYKGIKTFVTYKLKSSYSDALISRRYNQFCWLHTQLTEKYPCVVIPPLPTKQMIGRYQEDFIEDRKRHLQKWLTYIISHPVISYSETIKRFLTITDKDKWTNAKRITEKDIYKNGGFYNAVEAPIQDISWKNYSNRIEKMSNFIENYETTLRTLQEGYNAFHIKQKGPIRKEFVKIGSALSALSRSMSLNPDNGKLEIGLLHGMQKMGETYNKIGTLFRDQAKIDGELVEGNIEEIDGMIKEIPQLIQLAKCSIDTVETSTRKAAEYKLDANTIECLDQNSRIIVRTVDAELTWLQNYREQYLRSTMVQYLKNQIGLYTEITKALEESLAAL